MHVAIGVLIVLAGLIGAVVALQKYGVTISSFNPFLIRRRMNGKTNYGDKPIYRLAEPMEVAAVLILGVAGCEGEISAGQQRDILDMFETEFRIGPEEAADLLRASSQLIRSETRLADNLGRLLRKSQTSFKARQVESMLSMMHRTGKLDGKLNEEQRKLISATERYFGRSGHTRKIW